MNKYLLKRIDLKIAFFVPSLSGGGAERCIITMANYFADEGYDVDLLVAYSHGEYFNLLNKKVNFILLSNKGVLYSVYPLIKYLKNKNPMAIVSTLTHSNIAVVIARFFAKRNIKLILREANTPSQESLTNVKHRIINRLASILYPFADYVVGVSDGVVKDLLKYYPLKESKVARIYNPTPVSKISIEAQVQTDHPWLIDKNTTVLLAAGRLSKQKDFVTLIKAFSLLRKSINAKLIILGDGEEKNNLINLTHHLNIHHDVDFPGFVDNVFSFMGGADLFVLSSLYEGLPGVLIQALSSGCPVVATDCFSGPREILEDGKYGYLVKVNDEQSLVNAIRNSLLVDSRFDRNVIEEHLKIKYSIKSTCEQYLALIKS